ncbi:peptidase dimerization domain-containing protein [Virgibacillus dakarensis]|nr:peptidase dimerization domain-containing protein [Virgibacillus dakarensis]
MGYIRAFLGAVNVIPSKVEFTIDIRDIDPENIKEVAEKTKQFISDNCKGRKLNFNITVTENTEPVPTDSRIFDLFRQSTHELQIPSATLPSGAGHDAAIMARVCPSGMIFVRSQDGLSHCPEDLQPRKIYHSVANYYFKQY